MEYRVWAARRHAEAEASIRLQRCGGAGFDGRIPPERMPSALMRDRIARSRLPPESSARARRFANRRMHAGIPAFARSVALSGGLEGSRFFARIVMPDRGFALLCPTPSAPSPEPTIALRTPKLATLRSKTRVSVRESRFATRQRSPHRRDDAAPHRTVCYRGTAKRTGF